MKKFQLYDKVAYTGNKAHMKNWKGEISAISSNDYIYVVLWNSGALSTEHSTNLEEIRQLEKELK